MQRYPATATMTVVLMLAGSVQAQDNSPQTSLSWQRLHLSDIDGRTLSPKQTSRGLGVVFLSTECPIAQRYVPEINRLARKMQTHGLEIFGVLSDPHTTRSEAKKWQKEFRVEFPVIFDTSVVLAQQLGPTHTPEAFVINHHGKVVYRGRIDNFFGDVGRARPVANKHEFRDALHAVANGKAPAVGYVQPVGCPVEKARQSTSTSSVTFNRHVAPILFQRCANCHHEGAVAPFPLTSYQDAAKRASWLAEVTTTKRMPPWSPEPEFGHFIGERRLTQLEIETLAAWAKAGAPEGDPADLPPLPEFQDDWKLGEPDLVVRMPEPVAVPADGADIFRYVTLPIKLDEDKYVTAVDFRAGNARVVHHAIIATMPDGFEFMANRKQDTSGEESLASRIQRMAQMAAAMRRNGGQGPTMLGGWAPGSRPSHLPDGVGVHLPKKTNLLLQLHYYPSGKTETDQSEVGIYFAKKPVKKSAGGVALSQWNLNIPPGESQHQVRTSLTLPVDVTLLGLGPHMHLLGREMKVTATLPNGHTEKLIYVRDWDWNWQGQYELAAPLRLPKGTRLDLQAVYDNSASNPANPHSPPARVRAGRKTTDEMCICFLRLVLDHPDDQQKLRQAAFARAFAERSWPTQFPGRRR